MGLETEIKPEPGPATGAVPLDSRAEPEAAAKGVVVPAEALARSRRRDLLLMAAAALVPLLLFAATEAMAPGAALAAALVVGGAALLIERFGAPRLAPAPPAEVQPPAPLPMTEHRFAELARALLDELPDAIVLADEDGRMIAANKAARASFVGEGFLRKYLATAIRRPAILEAVQRARATGVAQSIEFFDLVPVERHFTAYVARIEPDPPRAGAVLLGVRDITQGKVLEQMRADFVANASHELRTPLSSLSGFIETLRGHAKDDPDAREQFLLIMHEQAQRMRRLIDDLLSLSRIELNEHVPPSGAVDLRGVVGEVAAALQPLAQAMQSRLNVVLSPELPEVIGARDELVQVIQNLVDNALKYGRPGSPVDIEAAPGAPPWVQGVVGPTAYISVVDRGEGVAREHIPRLTERFYRVDIKRSRERGGTGLGLAIVKHIVSRHRGKLHIKSEIGQGSTFTVIFPTAAATNGVKPAGLSQ